MRSPSSSIDSNIQNIDNLPNRFKRSCNNEPENTKRIHFSFSASASYNEDFQDGNCVREETMKKLIFGKCKVCNDEATGVHYGVSTCEGCKGFFKRTTLRTEEYFCRYENSCIITPQTRNRCKYCRFLKCLESGMSTESNNLI
jgi:hypothetical protein